MESNVAAKTTRARRCLGTRVGEIIISLFNFLISAEKGQSRRAEVYHLCSFLLLQQHVRVVMFLFILRAFFLDRSGNMRLSLSHKVSALSTV